MLSGVADEQVVTAISAAFDPDPYIQNGFVSGVAVQAAVDVTGEVNAVTTSYDGIIPAVDGIIVQVEAHADCVVLRIGDPCVDVERRGGGRYGCERWSGVRCRFRRRHG